MKLQTNKRENERVVCRTKAFLSRAEKSFGRLAHVKLKERWGPFIEPFIKLNTLPDTRQDCCPFTPKRSTRLGETVRGERHNERPPHPRRSSQTRSTPFPSILFNVTWNARPEIVDASRDHSREGAFAKNN